MDGQTLAKLFPSDSQPGHGEAEEGTWAAPDYKDTLGTKETAPEERLMSLKATPIENKWMMK